MEKSNENLIVCERCESKAVSKLPVVAVMLITASIMVWIPILGWIAAPIALLCAFVLMLSPKAKRMFKCHNCDHTFKVSNKVYKDWKGENETLKDIKQQWIDFGNGIKKFFKRNS